MTKIDTALSSFGSSAGTFKRPPSRFRDWVTSDGSTPYAAEAGRYHLYVSWACPWAHRTVIGRRLKGLEDVIGMSAVDPIRDERSWVFTGGEYTDPVNGFEYLSEAFTATDPDYEGRYSVPVLWDKRTGRIVNNESADILRMLSTGFAPLATDAVDLYPETHREEIDALNRQPRVTFRAAPRVRRSAPARALRRDQLVMTRSARSRVKATRSALRWSGPSAHARAASGDLPNFTWRAIRRSIRSASSASTYQTSSSSPPTAAHGSPSSSR